ncbi:Glutaredoxin 3 [Irineochytrium annulatum]|nr:Glutaredoxin 3 [Irineochytrium annulatum]
MAKNNVIDISSTEQYRSLTTGTKGAALTSVINFHATWAQQCQDMNLVFDELSNKFPALQFLKIEAEEFPEISEETEIAAVPTFLFFKDGKILDRIEGANAPLLTTTTEKHAKTASVPTTTPSATTTNTTSTNLTKSQLDQRLRKLVSSNQVMIFIKGTPDQPRCGFSRQLIEILTEHNVPYGSFNILADEVVRAGLKEFSNWPTFPQVYIGGELVGGLDIVKELVASGEFQKMVPQEEDLKTKLTRLTHQAPVMLFMKGNPDAPRCGFSRQIVKLIQDEGVDFETFDILEDDEVRSGLKEFSNWPTFPQLYVNGELVGGLDIVKELIDSKEFKGMVPAAAP